MRAISLLGAIVAVSVLAMLAVGCGDDDDEAASSGPDGGTGGVAPGGGLVARDKFLTYDGKRYELVNMLQENMAPESEFREIGQATAPDVDLKGDARVFSREGDSESVYTHSAPTADDGAFWLAWRLVTN